MVQSIEQSSSVTTAAPLQAPREVPAEQAQAADTGAGEQVDPATLEAFETAFGLAMFWMFRQETDRLRAKTEQLFNEMREEA